MKKIIKNIISVKQKIIPLLILLKRKTKNYSVVKFIKILFKILYYVVIAMVFFIEYCISCIMWLLPWFFLLSIVYLIIRLANLSYKTTCDQDQKIITLYKTRLVENDINFIEKICIEKTGRKQSVDCWEEQLTILNGAVIKKQTKSIIMD